MRAYDDKLRAAAARDQAAQHHDAAYKRGAGDTSRASGLMAQGGKFRNLGVWGLGYRFGFKG
jgi:hypothetical protein